MQRNNCTTCGRSLMETTLIQKAYLPEFVWPLRMNCRSVVRASQKQTLRSLEPETTQLLSGVIDAERTKSCSPQSVHYTGYLEVYNEKTYGMPYESQWFNSKRRMILLSGPTAGGTLLGLLLSISSQSGGNIPELDTHVKASTDNPPAIWSECDTVDAIPMPAAERPDEHTRGEIVNADDGVKRTPGDKCAVR